MKHLYTFALALALGSATVHSSTSYAQLAGTLDPSFGQGGKVFTSFGASSTDVAHTVALQSDGKLVVAGGGVMGLQVARYLANGTLDSSFGTNGLVTTNLGSSPASTLYPNGKSDPAYALSVVVQPTDGKIVLAGQRGYEFMLTRYLPNGTVDTSFGTNGVVTYPGANLGNENLKVMLDSSGRLLVLGVASGLATRYCFIRRYTPNGTLDTTFGQSPISTGFVQTNPDFSPRAALLDATDRLVIAGFTTNSGGPLAPAVVRLLPDGTLDTSFGTQGLAVSRTPANGWATGIAQQADGKIVMTVNGFVWRVDANGQPDTSFGTAGIAPVNLGLHMPIKPVVQRDGKIIIIGGASGYPACDFSITRVNSNGVADSSFATNGLLTFDEAPADVFRDALLQPDGRLVAVGIAADVDEPRAGSASRFALCRVMTNDILSTRYAMVSASTIRAYPSPASGLLHVELSSRPVTRGKVLLTLTNTLGQLERTITVASQRSTATISLDLRGLTPGIYWLRGQADGQATTFGQRVVIE